ncbi:hypothetical protein MTR_7g081610 [Medicago truncatula]|uniref:Uncharacterized protein n=1 Tax=Medicago truncatula TaxID=3880 RepID=G7KTG1_MEDTR|nr:hypothetical protein MTR_7g081610 [Medicago truncatula]
MDPHLLDIHESTHDRWDKTSFPHFPSENLQNLSQITQIQNFFKFKSNNTPIKGWAGRLCWPTYSKLRVGLWNLSEGPNLMITRMEGSA